MYCATASAISRRSSAPLFGPGKRLYGLMPYNNLGWVNECLVEGEMRPYMSAELSRVAS